MIKSMTGYGQGDAGAGGRTATAEIKSVNHRYSEISVHMPGRFNYAEDSVRQLIKSSNNRGKIDVSVGFFSINEADNQITFNPAVAKQYYSGFRELQKSFDTTGDITLELLGSMPDVFKHDRPREDEDAIKLLVLEAVALALSAFDEMRLVEGAKLKTDLEKRLGILTCIIRKIEERAPEVRETYTTRLKERIAALADKPDDGLLEQRLAIEIALFAEKSSIDEELVRMSSHIEQFRTAIKDESGEPVGKKLDFIVQEMKREVNTIGSKANDLRITDLIIELKNEVENIREQVQNIN